MLVAIGDACTNKSCGAFWTHQVLSPVLTRRCLLVSTVIQATKVGRLTLEAHVISTFENCILCQVVVIMIVGVTESSMLVQTFKLSPFDRLRCDRLLDQSDGCHFLR